MTRAEAIEKLKNNFGEVFDKQFLKEHKEDVALLRIRHESNFLPEVGIDGSERDNSEWVYIDMDEKIDTGFYGAVYYV